jgi:hypothetical protein
VFGFSFDRHAHTSLAKYCQSLQVRPAQFAGTLADRTAA